MGPDSGPISGVDPVTSGISEILQSLLDDGLVLGRHIESALFGVYLTAFAIVVDEPRDVHEGISVDVARMTILQ